MTRIRTVAIILILTLLIAPIFSFSAQAMPSGGGSDITPGEVIWIHRLTNPDIPDPDYCKFVENDAYDAGLVQDSYKFFASIWADQANQRVTVILHLNYAVLYNNLVDNTKVAKAWIYQEKDWAALYWKDEKNDSHQMYYEAEWTTVSNGDIEARFTFLTNPAFFHPGIFRVNISVFVPKYGAHDLDGKPLKLGYNEIVQIYGIFVTGQADVKDIHDAANWKEGEQPYTSITVAFSEGDWHVTLWYGAREPPISVAKGQVNTSENPDAYVVKDFGTYHNTVKTLRYNFTESDPAGVYVWIITSKYNGYLLTSYSWTVYNNKPNANPPKVTVDRRGTFQEGQEVDFIIKVDDDNSSIIKIWIIAWWGNNEIQMPEPSLSTVFAYFKPMSIENHGKGIWSVMLNNYGNLNLNIISKDSEGNLNITRVQYRVDPPSGAGYTINNLPSWFMWPWEDTLHLVLLIIGAIFVLTTSNTLLRVVGLILIAVSFVDFTYLQLQLQQFYPHLPGVIP